MWKRVCAVCLTAMLLASCANDGAAISGGCEWVRPILVSRADVLTDQTARDILAHNRAWEANCL